MSQSPLEKAATLSGGQQTNRHLPGARSPFNAFNHGEHNGRSLSALNLGSILNPVSHAESKELMDDYVGQSSSFPLARSLAGSGYTGDDASKHGGEGGERRSKEESTTLKWQPVETPQDHGSTEHYLYPYRPDLPLLANSLEFINTTPRPYDTLPRPNSAPMYTSPPQQHSSSSSLYYNYYHYPTPESPNIHPSTPFFHDDSRKRSLPLDHAMPKRARQNSDVVVASFPHRVDPPSLLYHHSQEQYYHPHAHPPRPPPPPPPLPLQTQPATQPPAPPKEKKKLKTKTDAKPAKKGRPLKNPALDAKPSIAQDLPLSDETKKPKKRGRPPKTDAEKKAKMGDKKKPSKKASKLAANKKESAIVLYCSCQRPLESPMYMLCCDHCNQYYHGACVHISRSEGDFLDLYYCAQCTAQTGKQSTLRPPCANAACDHPARVCTKGKERSKYCSDACGIQVARDRLRRAEQAYVRDHPQPQTLEQIMKAMLQPQQQGKSQLNIDSNEWDLHQLTLIKTERKKARKAVKFVDIQMQFLHCVKECLDEASSSEVKTCGYDSRLAWQSSTWQAVKRVWKSEGEIKVEFSRQVDGADVFTVCSRAGKCPKHDQWFALRDMELSTERRTQIALLTKLDHKRKQIETRIRQRLQQPEGWTFLENGTIRHD